MASACRAHVLRGDCDTDENVAIALALAHQVLRLAPTDELAHFLMSKYGEAGKLEDAVAECERGLEINPNSSMILGNVGPIWRPWGKLKKQSKRVA